VRPSERSFGGGEVREGAMARIVGVERESGTVTDVEKMERCS
jgi:hypothetical protein